MFHDYCNYKQFKITLSVTWPFVSSSAIYYKRSTVTTRLSCTVTEIWRLKR